MVKRSVVLSWAGGIEVELRVMDEEGDCSRLKLFLKSRWVAD